MQLVRKLDEQDYYEGLVLSNREALGNENICLDLELLSGLLLTCLISHLMKLYDDGVADAILGVYYSLLLH